jgi:galacturan 1,4-alpha-galacturonidase
MNGKNMWFDDILCNATAVSAPYGTNWVQNTDGFDTMDANNIMLTNMVYQGGDDCIAIKPRSYNIFVQNVPPLLSPLFHFLLIRNRLPAMVETVSQ